MNQRNANPKQRRSATAATVDRLPPHSEEMEQGVLACAFISPNECVDQCVEKFKTARVFYDLRHQTIYDAMVAMREASVPIEVISVQQWLKDRGTLEQVGGFAYLQELPDLVPSAASLRYYADIVFDKYLLRRAITACTESVAKIYDFEGDVPELLDGLEADIMAVNESRATTELRKMRDLMKHSIALVEDMHRGVGIIGGIRTHFSYFDKKTGGLHKKEMIVLAGRPGLGKTSLGMGIAGNVAKFEKKPVGVFSMEMAAEDLSLRLWCAEAEVNFHKLRTGFVSDPDLHALNASVKRVADLPIYIDDTAALSILELRAKARRMVHQFGCQLFIVDYLQLMQSTSDRAQNREQEVADVSRGLKAMAKELNLPVVVLAQLNRESEKRKHVKPQSSDLRESGSIEQDADLIGILYKPKVDGQDDDDDADEFKTNLIITKQRNGPTGDVEFLFKRWCMKFEDFYNNTGKGPAPAGAGISKIDPGDANFASRP